MKRKITCILVALALLMGLVAVANASTAITIVNTIEEFNAENLRYSGTAPIIENFQNDKINTPGLTITSVGDDYAVLTLGYYQNVVDNTTGSYQVVTYNQDLHGFGAWFDLFNPGGPGSSINVYIGTDPTTGTLVGNIANTYAGEFWGFYSDTLFNSIVIADAAPASNTSDAETYQMVDMALCAVPVPPSAILLGSALLGLVGWRRFRKG